MEVISFSGDASLTDQFLRLPSRLYRDDPFYIPPQQKDEREFLRPESMIYDGGHIVARHFLAVKDTCVAGRVSAFVNPALCDTDGTPVGAVGLFECIEDYTVAHELLNNAVTWLTRGHGLSRIWGPLNGDIWHGYRFMTRGYDDDVFVGEPYNPPYYPTFFQQFGFTVRREWDSLFVEGSDRIRQMIARGEQRLTLLIKQGYRFETFDRNHRSQQIAALHRVMSASYSGFLGYTPVTVEQLEHLFSRFEQVLDPDLFLLTYAPDGALVGFAIAFPDMPRAVRAMQGRNGFAARCAFLLRKDRRPRLNFYLGGITPEQERRATGLGRAGFYRLINAGLEKGYDCVLLTLRLKGNEAHGLAARSGVVPQHEYALYEYNYGC